jgi:hypothetical protein
VKPLPKVVEEKKQHLEEQWEEVKGMCRSLELHRNTVSACGVGKNIYANVLCSRTQVLFSLSPHINFVFVCLSPYTFSDVRLSANGCRAQVNHICKKLHDQIDETNARLIKDIATSEQVSNVYSENNEIKGRERGDISEN